MAVKPTQTRIFAALFPEVRMDLMRVQAAMRHDAKVSAEERAQNIHAVSNLLNHPAATANELARLSIYAPELAILPPAQAAEHIKRQADNFDGVAGFLPLLERHPWLLTIPQEKIKATADLLGGFLEQAGLADDLSHSLLRYKPEWIRREGSDLRNELSGVMIQGELASVPPAVALMQHIKAEPQKTTQDKLSPAVMAHVGMVSAYFKQSRFDAEAYSEWLAAHPAEATALSLQDPVHVRGAYNRLRNSLAKHGLNPIILATAVSQGATPSLWPNISDELKEPIRYAEMLGNRHKSAKYLMQAVLRPELRRMKAETLRQNQAELHESLSAYGIDEGILSYTCNRYPPLYGIGRRELVAHLKAVKDVFDSPDYSDAAYLKRICHTSSRDLRVLTLTPDEVRQNGNNLKDDFGPYGLTLAGLRKALLDRPTLLRRSRADTARYVSDMSSRLLAVGVDKDECKKLYAHHPGLFIRDASAMADRVVKMVSQFGEQGLTGSQVLDMFCKVSALTRYNTDRLIDNVQKVMDRLQDKGVEPATYVPVIIDNPVLMAFDPHKVWDNITLLALSQQDELLPLSREAQRLPDNPYARALANKRAIHLNGEQLALRRVWTRLTKPDAESHIKFIHTPIAVVEKEVATHMGAKVDFTAIAHAELRDIETRTGYRFSPLTYGRKQGCAFANAMA